MPVVSHSIGRGMLVGVHSTHLVVDNVATGDVFIPMLGVNRIVAVLITAQVDQSSFTGCTAQLFQPDGTTPITDALNIELADGDTIGTAGDELSNNNSVDGSAGPLVLTITNPGSDTLKMIAQLTFSQPLSQVSGQYVDHVPVTGQGAPIF